VVEADGCVFLNGGGKEREKNKFNLDGWFYRVSVDGLSCGNELGGRFKNGAVISSPAEKEKEMVIRWHFRCFSRLESFWRSDRAGCFGARRGDLKGGGEGGVFIYLGRLKAVCFSCPAGGRLERPWGEEFFGTASGRGDLPAMNRKGVFSGNFVGFFCDVLQSMWEGFKSPGGRTVRGSGVSIDGRRGFCPLRELERESYMGKRALLGGGGIVN